MSVSKNSRVRDVSISGGLRPSEAEELYDLDASALESGEYQPQDIPVLGTYIDRNNRYNSREEDSLPAENAEAYVSQLLDDPGEFIPEWNHDTVPFENFSGSIKEKRDEYTLRTVYALQDSLDQETIDETVNALVDQRNYKHNSASTCSGGNLGLFLGQYINEIEELVEDDTIVDEAYSVISESSETQAAAVANRPAEELPSYVKNEIHIAGHEISSDDITTRLRGTLGAGKCNGIEDGHDKSLLADQPTRNNTLIALDNEIVASLKYDGDESIVALQDLTHDGRQVLQKGMAYRASHSMLEDIQPERMEEDQNEYEEWDIARPERLELRPLRFVGESTQYSVEEIREQIDETRIEIEEELGFH